MSAVPESQITAILPSEPLDLSFRTAPHSQTENRQPEQSSSRGSREQNKKISWISYYPKKIWNYLSHSQEGIKRVKRTPAQKEKED